MSFLSIFKQKSFQNASERRFRSKTSVLRLETLENREMLSVSTFDYQELRVAYPEANLPASKYDVSIAELGGADVALANLKAALENASQTPGDDLILIDASATKELKFEAATDEISIDFDSSAKGAVYVVVKGDQALTIDAADKARVLNVGANAKVVFVNAVFKNGLAQTGGQATSELATYQFGAGGGVYNKGDLTLIDVSILDSEATYGAQTNGIGFFSAGGALYNEGTATVVGGTFSGNVARSGESGFNNVAMYGAGAAFFNHETAKMSVSNATFQNNVAENDVITKTITSTDEDGKETTETVQIRRDGAGGAIYNYGGNVRLEAVNISANNAAYGCGVFNSNSMKVAGKIELVRTTLAKNTTRYDGAGLYVSSGEATATCSLFAENVASGSGGGAYLAGGKITFQNATITNNSGASGGGVYGEKGSIFCYNSILAANVKGGDAAVSTGRVLGTRTLSSYSNWAGNSAQNFVYDAAKPLFVAKASGDYRLAANSQAIDLGVQHNYMKTTPLDLEGTVRVVGATQDLGAYEYYAVKPTATLSATTFVVKEDAMFLIEAASTSENVEFYWDLTGSLQERAGNFVRGPQEFFMSPKAQGLAPGVYEIRMKTKLGDVESVVQTAILKVEPSPTIEVVADVVDVAQGAGILRLNLDLVSGVAPSKWIVNWGDGTKTTINELSTGLDVAHFYKTPSTAQNYAVKVTVVDALGNGEDVEYVVANFAAPAASSATLETERDGAFAAFANDADDELFFADEDEDDFFAALKF